MAGPAEPKPALDSLLLDNEAFLASLSQGKSKPPKRSNAAALDELLAKNSAAEKGKKSRAAVQAKVAARAASEQAADEAAEEELLTASQQETARVRPPGLKGESGPYCR